MLSDATAETLTLVLGGYLAAGALFALAFAFRLAGRLDPSARHPTPGFRVLVIPGAILLWPCLLARALRSRP